MSGVERSTKQIRFEVAIYELSILLCSFVKLFHRQATLSVVQGNSLGFVCGTNINGTTTRSN